MHIACVVAPNLARRDHDGGLQLGDLGEPAPAVRTSHAGAKVARTRFEIGARLAELPLPHERLRTFRGCEASLCFGLLLGGLFGARERLRERQLRESHRGKGYRQPAMAERGIIGSGQWLSQ
jgi:hypothetical protein